jgi:putative addiction module killer protein
LTRDGRDVFQAWMENLRDRQAQTSNASRIATRVGRLAAGQFGDCKPLRGGIWELRIDYGPGYRIYYARAGHQVILLLAGGDKRRQNADLEHAAHCWQEWQVRQT